MLSPRKGHRGFTLVETLAAITVFAIMTLGLAPLLAASLRGSSLSRSFTVGKNVAVQAMERVRGLPFFVSGPKRVDVLDIYFPNKVAPGYAAPGVYTTTCTPAASSVACPVDAVPPGHTVTYQAAFVKKTAATNPEQYAVQPPPDGYSWDTATKPPQSLLRMVIQVAWTANDEVRTYQLESLIGDRRFGGLKIDGSAVVDYGVQISTGFSSPLGQESELSVVGGASESRVESKLLTTADQDQSAATLLLTDRTVPIDAGAQLDGAAVVVAAPPDQGPFSGTAGIQQLQHPDLGNAVVAGADVSSYTQTASSVTSDLPSAAGQGEVSASGALALVWADNQAETGDASRLKLADTGMVAWARPNPVDSTTGIEVATNATASPLASQQLLSTASVEVGSFLMLPTNYITDPTAAGAVVEVRGLEASVNCLAKPASGGADGAWGATLRYWQDAADEDGLDTDGDGADLDTGSYVEVALGDAAGADRLEEIQANPPLVYEDPTNTDPAGSPSDVYLFAPPPSQHLHDVDDDNNPATPAVDDDADPTTPDPQTQHVHASYLADWVALADAEVDEGEPQVVSAAVDGALRITTGRTNPALLETVMNVSLGAVSCRSLDAR